MAAVFALYAFLVWRRLRIALRARTDYEFFLAAGLGRSHGAADPADRGRRRWACLPLSGVVTPFLSYGRTAMLANFAMFGILLADLGSDRRGGRTRPFRCPRTVAGHHVRRRAAR